MAQLVSISDAADRVMAALVSGLEIEFGRAAGAALAERFLEAEEADFHWDARVEERWLGCYHGDEEPEIELDRVRILGRIDALVRRGDARRWRWQRPRHTRQT